MAVTYEWVVEQMDGEEIVDTSAFDTLAEAMKFAGTDCVICLRRDVSEDIDGEPWDIKDRQYAYPGDTEFEHGAAIPKKLMADFLSLSARAAALEALNTETNEMVALSQGRLA